MMDSTSTGQTYTFGSHEGYGAILAAHAHSGEHYDMSLNYEDFRAVLMGLRELSRSETGSESIRDRADSLISSIAETLGIELI